MKNTKWVLAITLVALLFTTTTAQEKQEWCASADNLRMLTDANPAMKAEYDAFREVLKREEQKFASRGANADYETIFIPVVFHVVHNGDAIGTNENINAEQIYTQIDALNRDYNNTGADLSRIPGPFRPLVANAKLRFCLAQFDPQGQPTTGIVRHQFANATWNTMNQVDSVLKPATIWDRNVYLNIWTVNMGGSLLSGGLLGYSSLPFPTTPEMSDGVTVRYNTVGTSGGPLLDGYTSGKTVAHEVGHWLGLFHVWGDDLGLCMTQGGGGSDLVDDTPDEANANFGCPSFPHITCSNGPNGDMFVNIMDYTDDQCGAMFTPGQVDRMRFVLNGFRSPMKIALTACFYDLDADVHELLIPGDTVCSLTFEPLIDFRNMGVAPLNTGTFYYQLDNGPVKVLNWTGPLETGDMLKLYLPAQTVTPGNHNFNVTFSNPNVSDIDNNSFNDSKTISFYAYDGGTASPLPFTQNFEGAFPSGNWSIENPDNDAVTWEQSPYSGYGTSFASMVINNRAYTQNPNRKRDALVSDNYDFSATPYPELSFDVAYARLNANRYDSLEISYSLDCGSTWTKVASMNGNKLLTAPDINTPFTPADSQWQTIHVPLWPVIGYKKVTLKLENISGWGNALYIDNINVKNNPAMDVPVITKTREDIKVFPNPVSNLLAIRLPFGHSFKNLQMLNTMGQVVYEMRVTDTAIIIPVENMASGLYLVNLTGDKGNQVEKVLIKR